MAEGTVLEGNGALNDLKDNVSTVTNHKVELTRPCPGSVLDVLPGCVDGYGHGDALNVYTVHSNVSAGGDL